jgi:hypothetical protein
MRQPNQTTSTISPRCRLKFRNLQRWNAATRRTDSDLYTSTASTARAGANCCERASSEDCPDFLKPTAHLFEQFWGKEEQKMQKDSPALEPLPEADGIVTPINPTPAYETPAPESTNAVPATISEGESCPTTIEPTSWGAGAEGPISPNGGVRC